MNHRLIKLFEKYKISEKDIHDFLQIYELLPPFKKANAIERFEEIMGEIEYLKKELIVEQEILFGHALESIEQKIYDMRKKELQRSIHSEVRDLKQNLSSS